MDIEAISDMGIIGALRLLAFKKNQKFIFSGHNVVTEGFMVPHWVFKDYYNIIDIRRKFGTTGQITTIPYFDNKLQRMRSRLRGLVDVSPLNYVPYVKAEVKELIADKLGWRDYGGKHYESVFTRFYRCILPRKFDIDKRKVHLSNLIMSGQVARDQALRELEAPPISPDQLRADYPFVIKKLGYAEEEFESYIAAARVEHTEFDTEAGYLERNRFSRALRSMGSKA